MKRWLFVCAVLALMTVSPAVLQTRPAMQSGTAPRSAAALRPSRSNIRRWSRPTAPDATAPRRKRADWLLTT